MDHEWVNVLLVGNGINRIIKDDTYSWAALLRKLKTKATNPTSIDLNNEFKPFTLSFEEIAFGKTRNYDESIKVLKQTIHDHYIPMTAGSVHNPIMTSSFRHIMTTNYDYTLENGNGIDFHTRLKEYTYKEEKTSLARKHFIQEHNKTIWHIHGEIDDHMYENPRKHYTCKSILIGYEQYAYYLRQIQNYIYGGTRLINVGLTKRLHLKEGENFKVFSWVDFFFVSNVHVIGLTFDFSEIHLWWLLNKRNEMIRNDKNRQNPLIKNKIKYYYRSHENRQNVELGDQLADIVKSKRQKAITDVLTSMGVECIGIKSKDYEGFYRKALEKAENQKETSINKARTIINE